MIHHGVAPLSRSGQWKSIPTLQTRRRAEVLAADYWVNTGQIKGRANPKHDLVAACSPFGVPKTAPNAEVKVSHPEAIPVILMTRTDVETLASSTVTAARLDEDRPLRFQSDGTPQRANC